MPTITFILPQAGQDADAGPIASNFVDLQTLLNGGLDGSNFSQVVAIALGAPGLTIGGDTNLYRSAANVLKTDDGFEIGHGVVIDRSGGGNKLYFGAAADVNLYRVSANYLKTDDGFIAAGELIANHDLATQILLSPDGRLYFGSAGDTNLYRGAANTLQTDDSFNVGGILGVTGYIVSKAGHANQIVLGDDGRIYFGNASDTNLYRSAANILKTDDIFQAAEGITAAAGKAGEVIISDSGGNGCIELGGQTGAAAAPFIDFHYGDGVIGPQDYNVRLQNSGNGVLSLSAPTTTPTIQIEDVTLTRSAANELTVGSGDTLKVSNAGLRFNDNTVLTSATLLPGYEAGYNSTSTDFGPTAVSTGGNGDGLLSVGSITVANTKYYAEISGVVGHATAAANVLFRIHEGSIASPGAQVGTEMFFGLPDTMSRAFFLRMPFTPAAGTREYHVRWKGGDANDYTMYNSGTPFIFRIVKA